MSELLVSWHTGQLARSLDELIDETALIIYTAARALNQTLAV